MVNIIQSCNHTAATDSTTTELPMIIGNRLLEKLDFFTVQPATVLGLGYGMELLLPAILQRYPATTLFTNNISAEQSIDLVFANLLLPGCGVDLSTLFTDIKRLLKPQGLFLFSTLGPDTLQELHLSGRVGNPPLRDMHTIGDCLLQTGFKMPVMEMEKMTVAYRKIDSLTHDLQALGIYDLDSQHLAAYEHSCNAENLSPVTYEVVYGHAWKMPTSPAIAAGNSSEIHVPISAIRKK